MLALARFFHKISTIEISATDFAAANVLLVLLIAFVVYQTSDLWPLTNADCANGLWMVVIFYVLNMTNLTLLRSLPKPDRIKQLVQDMVKNYTV